MTTPKNDGSKITLEQLAESINNLTQKVESSNEEIVQGQEKTAITMQELEARLRKVEATQPKLDTEAKLEAAVEAAKPGLLGGFKQASTTKKVLLATAGTAAVAGVAYAGYKGYEYYQDRKAADLPLIAVEAVPPVAPAKQDALRQSLSK